MQIISHRGYCGSFYVENTLEAVLYASQLDFVDGVEIDVRLSKDGVVVLMHDATINRTTHGKGKVGDMNYLTLSKVLVGSLEHCSKIPTLEEILDIYPSNKKLLIELKDVGFHNEELVDQVLMLVSKRNDLQILFHTSSPFLLRLAKEKLSHYSIGFIIAPQIESVLFDADFYSIEKNFIDKDWVKKLFQEGKDIYVYTFREVETIEKMREKLGVLAYEISYICDLDFEEL